MGIASGVTEMSSASMLSYFSVAVSLVREVRAYIISIPIRKRRMPPPIRKASMVIPKSWRIKPPRSANTRRIRKAYRQDSFATFSRAAESMPEVRDTKVRVAPRGLTMIMMEERERNANVTKSPAIVKDEI